MINFKCRASSANDLMSGTYGITPAQEKEIIDLSLRENETHKPLTDKQKSTLLSLEDEYKIKGEELSPTKMDTLMDFRLRSKSKYDPLTTPQRDKLIDLRDKKANPELPSSPKTVGITWLDNLLYQSSKSFTNKFVQKGNYGEDEVLSMVAKKYDLPFLFKDTEHLEDEYFTGTRDAFMGGVVYDAKSSWSHKTFPLWTKVLNPVYYAQMQIYMHLSKVEKARVCYGLVDTPNFLIVNDAYTVANERGIPYSDELYEEVREKHLYSHLPIELRLKVYEVEYDPAFIKEAQNRVIMVRKFLDNLLKTNPDIYNIYLERINAT